MSRGFALLPIFWAIIKQFILSEGGNDNKICRHVCTELKGVNFRPGTSNNTIINRFIAQNLGNKAKPRDHDPPGYFRS